MRHTYATGLLAAIVAMLAACGDNQEQEQENTMAYPAAASLPAPAAPPPAAPPKAEQPKAPPQQTLRLDGLRDGDMGAQPGTFSGGEGVGVVYAPGPDMYPFRVVAVQVVLAGELPGLEVAVHRAGVDVAPGERYAAATAGRTGAGVARVDLDGAVVRSGAVMVTAMLPKGSGQVPAFVVDPAVSAPSLTMAYVAAAQGAAPTWHRTTALGIRGAWALRLVIERAQ